MYLMQSLLPCPICPYLRRCMSTSPQRCNLLFFSHFQHVIDEYNDENVFPVSELERFAEITVDLVHDAWWAIKRRLPRPSLDGVLWLFGGVQVGLLLATLAWLVMLYPPW